MSKNAVIAVTLFGGMIAAGTIYYIWKSSLLKAEKHPGVSESLIREPVPDA